MIDRSNKTIPCKLCKKHFPRRLIQFMDFCPDCLRDGLAEIKREAVEDNELNTSKGFVKI